MKKARKLISLLLIVVSVLSFSLLAGCKDDETPPAPTAAELENKAHNEFITELGGVSETYTGEVSTSFPTKESAATAYVEEQVAGINKTVDVIDTVSKGDLNEQEIQALKIPEADKTGIIGVEEIEVTYTEEENASSGNPSGYSAFATLNTQKKVKVYIIKYQNDFKYFTPCPVNGETLSKNYYDSVFNSEKYKNCTYNTSMTMDINMTIPGQGSAQITIIIAQKMAITEDAILLENTITETMTIPGAPTQPYVEKMYGYIVNGDYGIECYISYDGEEWFEGYVTEIGFSSYEELTPFYGEYLDYTYFKKTNFGFELSNENAQKYIDEALGNELEESLAGLGDVGTDYDVEMFAKYYVKEGVLSGMRMDLNMDMVMVIDGISATIDYDIVAITTISNCGTTVVEQPFDNVA